LDAPRADPQKRDVAVTIKTLEVGLVHREAFDLATGAVDRLPLRRSYLFAA